MVGTVNMRERLGRWVEGRAVSNFIIGVIVFNAALLGMETAPALMEKYGTLILFLDRVCLFIFIAEITLKIIDCGGQREAVLGEGRGGSLRDHSGTP